jgi:hypothetical protein
MFLHLPTLLRLLLLLVSNFGLLYMDIICALFSKDIMHFYRVYIE